MLPRNMSENEQEDKSAGLSLRPGVGWSAVPLTYRNGYRKAFQLTYSKLPLSEGHSQGRKAGPWRKLLVRPPPQPVTFSQGPSDRLVL